MILCILKADEKSMPTACETVCNYKGHKKSTQQFNKKEIGF